MTIKELYEQVRDGRIVSDIALQRDIVYSPDKQSLVIDSIICGIPLPAFYLWLNDDGILEVLDGKQRIEAIKKPDFITFLRHHIAHNDNQRVT